MPNKRSVVFATNEIYHTYNRSVANEEIFNNSRNINRALDLINYYKNLSNLRFSYFVKLSQDKKNEHLKSKKIIPLVEVYAFSIMPNHFHLLVRQLSENGIEKFLSNFQNSFAKYYNIRNKRYGALFQRPFKAKHVAGDKELLHLSRYIHLNPVTSFMLDLEELKTSNLTSFPHYLKPVNNLVNSDLIIKLAGSKTKYLQFVSNQVDYQRKLGKINHLIIKK
ncbi:transposase [Candidatus Woesebacteria bacterium]|nr:MAG: transposase [Candidatus Woesebacteria bacterium]